MSKVPQCLGIIIDGNRRWARERGLPTLEGHRLGLEKVSEVMRWAQSAGIGHVIIYAFSTENWNRSPEEVNYLMNLFRTELLGQVKRWQAEKIRLRFIGSRERLDGDIQRGMEKAERDTAEASIITLVLAVSYGGRPEIVAAVNKLIQSGTKDAISEDLFAQNLWTVGIPDPDLIIRTAGEQRLSNFLTWQSVYSELFFIKTYWPDFSEAEFKQILAEYAGRERRFGQ